MVRWFFGGGHGVQGRLRRLWLAGVVLLWALPSAAQVAFGDLHAGANGLLTAGYAGDFGNQQTSAHSMTLGGSGTIGGYYYNPQFVSFSVMPYYNRSQDNSESQSITDASGYTGTLNIFNGSHYPGFVTVDQMWNNSGTFGIPGEEGLKTKNDSHGLAVGWSLLFPDLPALSIGYSDTSGSSSLLGSDTASTSANRNFSALSTYRLAGFFLNGGFIHVSTDANITGLENGEAETTSGSSNQYRLSANRSLPYNHSSFSIGLSRGSYSSNDSLGGESNGTTDTANVNVGLMFPKLPVVVTAYYTDNLFGSFQQQLISSGQAPVPNLISPESRSLSLTASTFYTILPRLVVSGYGERTEQYVAGQSYGLTRFGVNVNYSFEKAIKGLTFAAGAVESADQQGNTRVGFVGHANYRRSFGRWEVTSFAIYDQDVETLLVTYTTSNLNYGGSFKRNLGHDLHWVGIANATRSVFEQQAGNASHGESFSSMLMWRRASVSANYTESNGTSILTANGLVATPLPPSMISPGNVILYNGTSEGGTFKINPLRNLAISTAYSKAHSNTVSPLLMSNNGSKMYNGLATYQFRKVLFNAGFTKFQQDISSSSTLPSVITSYFFGVSRWFKGF